jgi:tRNA A37 threonylcarbamoyladenosine biosynthesis protein TsaE
VALAQLLADACAAGDVLCLHGAVGAGKSYFWRVALCTSHVVMRMRVRLALRLRVAARSRAFVRALVDDPLLPVPSPTFLLLQAYEEHTGPCVRFARGCVAPTAWR